MSFTIDDIFDDAQSLLNDTAAATYTDAKLLKLVKIAHREIRDRLNTAGYQTNLEKETKTITAGASTYGALPAGMDIPHKMEERTPGSTNDADWTPMESRITEPPRESRNNLEDWIFRGFNIHFIPALTDREIRFWYWGKLLPVVVDGTTVVSQERFQNYLMYRLAALAARVIGEDTDRAADMQGQAIEEMELIKKGLAATDLTIRIVRPPRVRRF